MSSVNLLSVTFPNSSLYDFAWSTGVEVIKGTTTIYTSKAIAIEKLYLAILDALSFLSNIISSIPATTKKIIPTENKDVKSNLSTGNLINE